MNATFQSLARNARKMRVVRLHGIPLPPVASKRCVTGEREAEKAEGTTPELRKTVANLLMTASQRVNAVAMLDPDNAKAAEAIEKVTGIIKDLKRVASEAKHRKGDTPDPEPEPTPAPEPNGDSPVS